MLDQASELGRSAGQQLPVRSLLLPVHQDMEVCGALLAIGDSLAFAAPVKSYDGGGADNADAHIVVGQGQELRFSVRGVGNESGLVLDPAVGMAVTELRR